MKAILKYQANDGSEWSKESDAKNRDDMMLRVEEAMAPLGPKPTREQEDKGWIQHNPETVIQCMQGILDLCKPDFAPSCPVFNTPAKDVHPMSIIGRILCDSGSGPRETAWRRFANIDPHGREHEQPYYAYTAGPRPEHVCVEDRRK